jgi:acetoin utilization protein AcuC
VPDPSEPLLVFGPRSLTYDFGPEHPLTPRRFGPGIDLLRALGAEPGLAPEPATDGDLLACHTADYVATVRAFSDDPSRPPVAGIGTPDDPAFGAMHDAASAVAGGSLAAADAILRGDVRHAFHPGGGLHHAMADRASGFCVYDDPALAIARFRAAGLRVLYLDFDTHHGDGVQSIHLADPGVLTFSIHESGRYLFPGSGFVDELGPGAAGGTSVNVPLEPFTGERAWLDAIRSIVPALAAVFAPDVVVSQHGADSHAWDPLAHLRVTTTAMGEAARLVDRVAHRYAGGRWLATGGGGYDVYRVVPRAWSLVWLAGAHRAVPAATPEAWRERWAGEAARYGQAPLPERFDDDPNAGRPLDEAQEAAEDASRTTAAFVRRLVLPALIRGGIDRGWLDPLAEAGSVGGGATQAAEAVASVGRSSAGAEAVASVGRFSARVGQFSDDVEVVPGVGPSSAGLEVVPAGPSSASVGPSSAGVGPSSAGIEIVADLSLDVAERLALASRTLPIGDGAAARTLAVRAVAGGARVAAAVGGGTIVGLGIVADAGGFDELLVLGVAPAQRQAGLGTALLRSLVERQPAERELRATVAVGERDPTEPLDRAVRVDVARRLLAAAGFRVHTASGRLGRDDPNALEATLGS